MARLVLIAVVALTFAGCCWNTAPAGNDNLYAALGKREGISAIVDEFIYRIGHDQRIVHRFDDTDLNRLRRKLVEKLCAEAGGPCKYTGDSMEQVHKGMDIDETEFNAIVEDLQAAMDYRNVPIGAQNRLIARLVPMRADIIHH